VIGAERKPRHTPKARADIAVAEPLVIALPDESETQRFVEIRDVSSGSRLITVLEILSPSNKRPGDAQEQYLRKQLELVQAGVSLVEIDLLREGDWVVAVPYDALAPEVRTPYRVIVRRGWHRCRVEYYPISLADALPTIRVPLRPTDVDAPLNIQALVKQCYENGGYDDIDYTTEPEPRLTPAAARWAGQLLRQTGRRPATRRRS
jgi:hypothetical protein